MRLPGRLFLPLLCLAAVHFTVLLAGFFAPYDPATQDRDSPASPPMRVHWNDALGHWHWRPFVYGSIPTGEAAKSTQRLPATYPIELLPRGVQYRILGISKFDRHLFGVTPPGRIYIMGTDNYGRDVFTRLLYGGQISLLAGLLATILSLTLAIILGTIAGFYGSYADTMLMRGAEFFLALPWLYLLLALRASLPLHSDPRQTFLLIIAVIGLIGWARPARLIRGVVLSARERGHVKAARGFGASNFYLLRRHILPETRSVVSTQAALLIPQYVLAEVTLSFLGLGVAEPVASWGSMLASLQQYHVLVSEWWMFFPGLLLVLVFLSFGVLANGLQDGTTILGVGWNAHSSLEKAH